MIDELIIEKRGDCYVYGSVHIRKPPEKLLELADKLVDYVLLEGVNTRVKPSLRFIAYWFPTYLWLTLVFWLEKLLSRLLGHRGDMKEIKAFFERRNKKVEVADRDVVSVIEYCFQRARKWQPLLMLTWLILIYSSWLFSVYLLPLQMPLNVIVISSVLVAVIIGFPVAYIIMHVLSRECMLYRDKVVIERALELISEHNILIARGKRHISVLKEELERHGIKCKELEID